MMHLEILRLLRDILLRSVVVSIVIAILLGVTILGAWDTWMKLAMQMLHTDSAHLSTAVIAFFTEIRFYVLFLLLAPGLAIHWTLKSELKKQGAQKAGPAKSAGAAGAESGGSQFPEGLKPA